MNQNTKVLKKEAKIIFLITLRTFWHHAHFNKHGHLVFEEHSAWERSKCAEALKQRFPQETSGINYKYIGWY